MYHNRTTMSVGYFMFAWLTTGIQAVHAKALHLQRPNRPTNTDSATSERTNRTTDTHTNFNG